MGEKSISEETGYSYSKYNNYTIFEKSFEHLKENQDLYIHYPSEHWDLNKYTPTFSVFFGFFSLFPDWLGLSLWNLLNVLIFFLAVALLPHLTDRHKAIMLLICLVELLTSVQNEQSNGLMAGLMILTFVFLERNNYLLATLLIIMSVYLKLFGIVGLVLFLFYPRKWKLFYIHFFGVLFCSLFRLFILKLNSIVP